MTTCRGVTAPGRCAGIASSCVQHSGIRSVAPADHIDPAYGEALREAVAVGVEVYALGAAITPGSVELVSTLPVVL